MISQKSLIRTLLKVGICGSILMYMGDMLLFGNMKNTDSSITGFIESMQKNSPWRLYIGGGFGPLASVFYCLGFYGLSRNVKNAYPILKNTLCLLFCTAMIFGGAYHSHYPYIAAIELHTSFLNGHIFKYYTGITLGAVIPMALASIMFIYLVLTGKTQYRRTIIILSPLALILLSPLLELLPQPLFTYITIGWNNLLFVIFFSAALFLSAATTQQKKGQTQDTLANLSVGKSAEVSTINTSENITLRLASLGLLPGSLVFVRRSNRNAVVVEYKGTFLAISHKLARQIALADHKGGYGE